MKDQSIERASCRFVSQAVTNGSPVLRLELFHRVPALDGMTVELELLRGTTSDQVRKLAESLNERTIGVIVTTKEMASS